jgi:hypothetical protein
VWRTRRYLADASAVQLNRNPSDLADALRHLSQDTTTVIGGEWTSHLFLMDPKGDSSLAHTQQSPEHMQRSMQAWLASAPPELVAILGTTDVQKLRSEIMATQMAALRGDPAARARMMEFAKVMSSMKGMGAYATAVPAANRQTKGATGLGMQSMVSFHPSLKRRLRKLERMGAHYSPEAHARRSVALTIFMTLLYVIIVPMFAVVGGALLLVMAMMIMMNMVFLGMWMMVIHAIFTWLAGRH